MNKMISFFQFLPLTIFLLVAKSHGFQGNAWFYAFQLGAIAALIETSLLLLLVGQSLNRLLLGVNLFLVLGGAAMLFSIHPLQNLMDDMRAAGLIFCVSLVCVLATLFTKTGIFEKEFSANHQEIKFSRIFLIAMATALVWSYFNRGNMVLGGAVPLVFLSLFKSFLQHRILQSR